MIQRSPNDDQSSEQRFAVAEQLTAVAPYGASEIAIVTVFFAVVLGFAWFAVGEIEDHARENAGETLQTILNMTNHTLALWEDQREQDIIEEAQDPRLVDLTIQLLDIERNRDALLEAQALTDVRQHFRPQLEEFGDLGIFVIAPDYVNIASLRDANIGHFNLIADQRLDILERVFDGETALVPPIRSDVPLQGETGEFIEGYPTMFIASPIRDRTDAIIAVLAIRIDLFQDFTRLAQQGQFGETGETYGFDRDGMMLTDTRFRDDLQQVGVLGPGEQAIITLKISDPGGNLLDGFRPQFPREDQRLTVMAASAVAGESGLNVQGYRDYRGVEVFGAWLWNEDLGYGLATEIDAAEALDLYGDIRNILILLVGGTILMSIFLTGSILRTRWHAVNQLQSVNLELESRVEARTKELREEISDRERMQNELRESEQRFRQLMEVSIEGIAIRDGDTFIDMNNAFAHMFGYTMEELTGRNLIDLIAPESRDLVRQNVEMDNDLSYEFMGLRKGGSTFPVEVHDKAISYQGRMLRGSAVRDLTQRKRIEQHRMALKLEIERVAVLERFITNASHDLNTPLTAISMAVYLLKNSLVSDKQLSHLESLEANTERLKTLLKDMVDMVRLDGTVALESKPANLSTLVKSVYGELLPLAEARGHTIVTDYASERLPVYVDRFYLNRAVTSLLVNAYNYTPHGGRVILRTRRDGVRAIFEVVDTGIGIDEDHLGHIFERFYRVDRSRGSESGGTGLGLAIAKKIVEAHQGHIEAESELGKGSTFRIILAIYDTDENLDFDEALLDELGA